MRCVRRKSSLRGVVAVIVAVLGVLVVGFVALTLDLGRLYMVRTELQRAADSAAMAGASVYTIASYLNVDRATLATARSQETSLVNDAYGNPTNLAVADIVRGVYDFTATGSGVVPGGAEANFNGCQVTVRCDGQINGTIPFLFAPVFGQTAGSVQATARAVFDTRVAGYTPGSGALIPFAMEDFRFEDERINGPDAYSYDPATGPVSSPDGVPEVSLYIKEKNAPGNYGLLNVNNPNNGVPELSEDIEYGITPDDLETETGSSELTFVDGGESPVTYSISGNPGLKGGLEPAVQSRLGDVIAFFLFDTVTGNGANVVYNITGIRFGRLVYAQIQGNKTKIIVQPVVFSGPGIRLDPAAPPFPGSLIGRIVLVK